MTGLQIALASGTLIGLALALLVWRLAPSAPDLVDVLDRLSPDHVVPRRNTPGLDADTGTSSAVDRIGLWAMKNLPGGSSEPWSLCGSVASIEGCLFPDDRSLEMFTQTAIEEC